MSDPLTLWPLAGWQLAAFLPAALPVGLTPGPNNFLALSTAGRAGPRAAIPALGGRAAAFLVLTGLVALGLDQLLSGSQPAFSMLKWGGVAYLLWLAWRTWSAPVDDAPQAMSGGWKAFVTLMANLKAYLPMTAFLPQVLGAGPALPQLVALGVLYVVMACLAALVWIGAGGALRRGAPSARGRRLLNRVFGGLIGVAALLLARASRPV